MAQEAGEENFSCSVDRAAGGGGAAGTTLAGTMRTNLRPEALDLIFSGHFSRNEPGIFEPIRHALLDEAMLSAPRGPAAYAGTQNWSMYANRETWSRKAVIKSHAGQFSRDRTIRECRRDLELKASHVTTRLPASRLTRL